jgi:hypothetical protein
MAINESELKLLEEFHKNASEKEGEAQASAIRNGYLPETPEGLVEAGIRCIPLAESQHPSIVDAGTDRLRAIIFKLKMAQGTIESRRAVEQFEQIIEQKKKEESSNTLYGLLLIGGLVLLITAVVFIILRMFLK